MKQSKPVVYSGKVGSKMRARRVATSRAMRKQAWRCAGGPMAGRVLYLSTPETLEFTMAGMTGRYKRPTTSNFGDHLNWEPKNA